MKTIFLVIMLFVFNVILSDVNFDFALSCEKIDSEDQLVRMWIDDVDENGEDELYAAYNYQDTNNDIYGWRIIKYDFNGNIISTLQSGVLSENVLLNCATFNYQNNNNIILTFKSNSSSSSFLYVKIYDLDTQNLVAYHSFFMGSSNSYSGDILSGINYVKSVIINNNIIFHIGITKHQYNYGPEEETFHAYYSEIHKISFENGNLDIIESIDDCGHTIMKYYNYDYLVSIGYYYSDLIWPGQIWEKEVYYYLKLLSYETPTEVIDITNIEGSSIGGYANQIPIDFNILNINDDNFSDFGLTYFYSDVTGSNQSLNTAMHFIHFPSDFSSIAWSDSVSNIIDSELISSTCVSVNNENNFIIYFSENQLEIRDVIDGEIIYSQNSSIEPFCILRKTDNELLFVIDNDSYYDFYILSENIQVSITEYELSSSFNLTNFPNPFNPTTEISFNLTTNSHEFTRIEIYNSKGQKVKTIACHPEFIEGRGLMNVTWNGDDENSKPVSSGVYLYKLVSGNKELAANKMLLLK